MIDRQLQILRSLDKHDRVGDVGVFDLLTDGRADESGDVTPGCGLAPAQAAVIVGFVNAGKETPVARRFWLMAQLESTVVDGETLWDKMLAGKPENIGWALDDLYAALESRLGRDPRGPAGNDRVIREMEILLAEVAADTGGGQ